MASTTSGSTTFNMDVDDILEQAWDAIGGEHTSAIDAQKARRTLNLVLIQLQNKNIPLNKLDFVDQALSADTAAYELDDSIIDVIKCNIFKDTTSLPIQRYGLEKYQTIPKKSQTAARPNLFTTERNADVVTMTFWPVPDSDDCTAKLLVSRKVEDVTASYQKLDISTRYLPLLIAWLSYELSKSRQGIPEDLRARLERDYKDMMEDTFSEDMERVDFNIRPKIPSGR